MSDIVVSRSRNTFADTVALVTDAIEKSGARLFATIDQRSAAQSVGLTLRPTTLLVFGNPKGGTALMEAYPLAALDLPLKILVWEDAGDVHVAYVAIDALVARYAVAGHEALIGNLERTLADVVRAVA